MKQIIKLLLISTALGTGLQPRWSPALSPKRSTMGAFASCPGTEVCKMQPQCISLLFFGTCDMSLVPYRTGRRRSVWDSTRSRYACKRRSLQCGHDLGADQSRSTAWSRSSYRLALRPAFIDCSGYRFTASGMEGWRNILWDCDLCARHGGKCRLDLALGFHRLGRWSVDVEQRSDRHCTVASESAPRQASLRRPFCSVEAGMR